MKNVLKKAVRPIERFLHLEASSGVFLFVTTLAALFFANTGFSEFYKSLLQFPLSIQVGYFDLSMNLQTFVNDVLMSVFFFVVGLEIKRELVMGSLSSKREALLPVIAAIGGMLIPALIYLIFNYSKETVVGWAVPTATDIAFALGVLSFVSKKIPLSLKIFLLSLATIDDLGAIIIIATVYSSKISSLWLALAGMTGFIIFFARKLKVQSSILYLFLGVALWFFIHESGIHSTISGVILGLLTPVRPLWNRSSLNSQDTFIPESVETYQIENLKKKISRLQSPAQALINQLHLFVGLFIMPVFAFFNSGIEFNKGISLTQVAIDPVVQGVMLGLLIGKPIGVFGASWLAVKFKIAKWPTDSTSIQVLGVGFLAGIGFTMAFFISNLSLGFNDQWHVYSKLSILLASALAGLIGYLVLRFFGNRK